MITVFDTETTGLIKPKGNDISIQPYLIEICAIQFKNDGTINAEIETLIKPPIEIPAFITKLTGITNDELKDAPEYAQVWKQIAQVFFQSHTLIAHNAVFDVNIIAIAQERIGRPFNFPYPPIHFCTVEQSLHLKGYRLKNSELYKIATGKEIENSHRARADVLATYESYKWLINEKNN